MKRFTLISALYIFYFLLLSCGGETNSPTGSGNPQLQNPNGNPTLNPTQNVSVLLSTTRQSLLDDKKTVLEQIIATLPSSKPPKKQFFTAALEQYEKFIPAYAHESISIIADTSVYSQAATDIIVGDLYATNITTTRDWMHYHLQESTINNAVVSYLDFANSSLGGGAFAGGWVQEEQMVAFCTEFALLLAGENVHDLKNPKSPFITRSTTNTDTLSPRPKYLTNIRCGSGTAKGYNKTEPTEADLQHVSNPPAINIIAAATVSKYGSPKTPYSLPDVLDLFANIYRAFELVQNHNKKAYPNQPNVIFGGRIGAGVFAHSVSMSAAMQIFSARILGIEHLVLTGSGFDDKFQVAIAQVNDFLSRKNIKGMKIETMLSDFLSEVKNDDKWFINSSYK